MFSFCGHDCPSICPKGQCLSTDRWGMCGSTRLSYGCVEGEGVIRGAVVLGYPSADERQALTFPSPESVVSWRCVCGHHLHATFATEDALVPACVSSSTASPLRPAMRL